jgi:FtsZ-binding cell division protein ZapB
MIEWLKKNASVAITIGSLSAGGVATYTKLEADVGELKNKITSIETSGTETTRNLQKDVDSLKAQNNELGVQMRETKELLLKLDKRVGYLLCKQDKRFCVE